MLIVSDLPLRNPPPARREVAGIEYVLRQRHYTAGKFKVGYQSCDDSSARTGAVDPSRCAANAQAYAANEAVVGVLGPYNSPCAAEEIPIANSAPRGPLVMIGTATTDPELTAATPGGDLGTPQKYYPTGSRNFVRLAAPDQFQAAASALLAKRLGLTRVFVLNDGEGYGQELSMWFKRAAARMGVRIVGEAGWDPRAKTYRDLAARVAAARPDGVYLGGYALPVIGGAAVLRSVRHALADKNVAYMAPDGFLDAQDLGRIGEGLYATFAGVPADAAGSAGKKLFAQTGPDPALGYGALYGATATELLLDAIANSDGSRASINGNVLAAKTPPGIIGRFGFDNEGDPTVGAVTIFRFGKGRFSEATVLYPTVALAKAG